MKKESGKMSWFKCLEPNDPLMFPIVTVFGMEGYGLACKLLAEACRQKVYSVEIEHLCNWLSLRNPKAKKLLPYFQKLLSEYWRLPEIKTVIPDNKTVIKNNTTVTSPQNPHGSIKDRIDKNRLEENRIEENGVSGNNSKPYELGSRSAESVATTQEIFSNRKKENQSPSTLSTKKETPNIGRRLSSDWSPSDILLQWAKKERPDLDLSLESASFKDYWIAMPGQKGVKLDWDATFRNWIRRAQTRAAKPIDMSSADARLARGVQM